MATVVRIITKTFFGVSRLTALLYGQAEVSPRLHAASIIGKLVRGISCGQKMIDCGAHIQKQTRAVRHFGFEETKNFEFTVGRNSSRSDHRLDAIGRTGA